MRHKYPENKASIQNLEYLAKVRRSNPQHVFRLDDDEPARTSPQVPPALSDFCGMNISSCTTNPTYAGTHMQDPVGSNVKI